MIFSSIIFLFHFLPFTLAAYYIAPPRAKNTVLFVCSLVFYCWGEVRFFPVMLTLILINYLCGLAIAHFEGRPGMRRLFLALALVGSLGMLFYFKYANFVLESANALLGTASAFTPSRPFPTPSTSTAMTWRRRRTSSTSGPMWSCSPS